MRIRLVLGAAVAVAAAVLPAAPASAVCAELGLPHTVACNPCGPVNQVLLRYGTHVDCFM